MSRAMISDYQLSILQEVSRFNANGKSFQALLYELYPDSNSDIMLAVHADILELARLGFLRYTSSQELVIGRIFRTKETLLAVADNFKD